MSIPEIKPRVTPIAKHTCPNCGEDVRIVTNKNMVAYYYCPGIDTKGDVPRPCSHHEKWGRAASQRMIDRYLTKGQRPKDAPANTNAPPTSAAANVDAAPDQEAPKEQGKGEWDDYFG